MRAFLITAASSVHGGAGGGLQCLKVSDAKHSGEMASPAKEQPHLPRSLIQS